jgi:adenylyltransferase/sulfurtransferase
MGLAASGIGKLILVDFDRVDHTNLHRQYIYNQKDINRPKAISLQIKINELNPAVQVEAINGFFDLNSGKTLLKKADVILDCCDHMPTKFLINDLCVLQEKPLVYGSMYKFTAYVATFNLQIEKATFSANLRDFFEEDNGGADLSCEQVGILNPIVNICAAMQVQMAIDLIINTVKLQVDKVIIYDLKTWKQSVLRARVKRVNSSEIQRLYEGRFDKEVRWKDIDLEKNTLLSLLDENQVKDKNLKEHSSFLKNVSQRDFVFSLPQNSEVFVYCRRGISSLNFIEKYKALRVDVKMKSIIGGMNGYEQS